MLQELLNGSSRDPSEHVRTAARSALAQLPLTALSLLPLLTVLDKAAATDVDTPAPKTRKRSKAEFNVKHAAEELNVLQLAGQQLPLITSPTLCLPCAHTLCFLCASPSGSFCQTLSHSSLRHVPSCK